MFSRARTLSEKNSIKFRRFLPPPPPAPLRRRPAREVCQVLGSPRVQDRHPLQGQQGAGLLPGRHGRCPRPATTSGRGRENERVRGLSG